MLRLCVELCDCRAS
uniref:Uncharacterized protein n=1 Tax=Anguilla anguilla TaxID=7936 RepID=A0A0E9UTX1_ANGAN